MQRTIIAIGNLEKHSRFLCFSIILLVSYILHCIFIFFLIHFFFLGYDGHLIFENLAKLKLKKAPTVIAKSQEKFISIQLGPVEFKDSLQFLNSSLDKLVKNLKDKGVKEGKTLGETFPHTYEYFKRRWTHVNEDGFELLTRKGIYPYEYMDSWDKMQETSLPSKEQYFSKLSGKDISDKDYSFAEKIWEVFELKNLGELHDLYMGTDVTQLADVFESF